MIEHDVLNNLYATFVTFVHPISVILITADTRVSAVVIGNGITMITLFGHVILQSGSMPDSRYAEVLQVIKVLCHACQVATVTCHVGTAPCVLLHTLVHLLLLLVGGTGGKTVGHEQVHHITGIKRIDWT